LVPTFSGPKHQIFKASVLSQSKSLANFSALILGSAFGSIYSFSIASTKLAEIGDEVANILLCLFADLVSKGWVTS
jgi:hypothetical protein